MNFDAMWWCAAVAAVLVGLSKGGLPAVGMMAVPILALVISPVKAAVLLLPIFVISDMVGIWLYRREFSIPNIRILIPAGLLGVAVGWATASWVSDLVITFLIGFVGVGFCLNYWLRNSADAVAQPPGVVRGWFWGALAGFTSFISHAGSPPYQVYMLPQKLPKAVFAGTSTIVFAAINAAKIIPYQHLRPYSTDTLWYAAWLVPFALGGAVAGAYLTRKMAELWFYRVVMLALFAVSVQLIISAVLKL
jgi:uncharacterized protein